MSGLNILITGGSSGIGMQLAIDYAKMGHSVYITGRNENSMKSIQGMYHNIQPYIVDVRDRDKMSSIIYEINEFHPLDIVIINAGVSENSAPENDYYTNITTVFDTNINGVWNTFIPAIHVMKNNKRRSTIAIVSSMAGITPMLNCPSYSTSKVFVTSLCESFYHQLKEFGINLSCIYPGYIKTPLTDKNHFKMPLLMNAEEASKIIINGIQKNKRVIAFPLRMWIVVNILRILPFYLRSFIMSFLPKK
jgi:short-subunit dehydrogenase